MLYYNLLEFLNLGEKRNISADLRHILSSLALVVEGVAEVTEVESFCVESGL
jgi:hypothetical protein